MPIYFLIDTNIWIHELVGTDNDNGVRWIEYLTQNDKIRILVPETLLKEWKKQAAAKLKESQNNANAARNNTRQAEGVVSSLDDYMERMTAKEKRITELLSKGITIKESEAVGKETIRRFKNDIAPFHNNPKSNADSLIYLASVEYIKDNGAASFVFLTNNSKDFGAPDSPKTNLHNDLLFEGLDIQYYNNLNGLRNLFKTKPGFEESITPAVPANPSTGVITIIPQKNAGLLEYLYLVLQKIHTQMGFVPCHLLVRLAPFKIADRKKRSYAYYSNYTFNTNNPELLDFFESIDFRQTPRFKKDAVYENTIENLQRLIYIIKHLNGNLVFHISEQTSSRNIDIRPRKKEITCNCLVCCFERMELAKVLERLKNWENENLYDVAFVAAFLNCNEIASAATIVLIEAAFREREMLLYFRLLYHIQWLEQLTFTHQGIVDHESLRKWKNADKDAVFKEFMQLNGFWKDCADYFYNSYFEGDYGKDIYEVTHAIREHHTMQVRGGTSGNSNLYNLSARFGEFEAFLKANRMPFFRFSNFSRIFDQYTEAIFLSLTLNQYQSSRLDRFNDLIIRQFIIHGKPRFLVSMCNRYARNGIAYKADDPARPVTVMIRNLLSNLPLILLMEEEKLPEKSNFRDQEESWRNALVLLSVVKFDTSFIRECAELIYKHLVGRKEMNFGSTNELSSFLSTRLKLLERKDQKKWLLLCITVKAYQSEEMLYSFTKEHLKGNLLLTSATDFKLMKENLFPIFLKPNNNDSGVIINLCDTMGKANRKKMKAVILEKLKNAIDFPLFYNASIHKVINPNPWLKQYATHFGSLPKTNKRDRSFFREDDAYLTELNQLINLYFSLNKELPAEVVTDFSGNSHYYDWLLDMKHFDYRKFKPIWVTLYATRYYLKRIFSIPQVRLAIREWLKTNTHEMIAKYYALYVD